jgi:curved DNA-binding protein CbpA
VLRRAEGIDRENYFSMLGVTREASDAEIQAAYYALAKAWHPDRLPPELARVRDLATRVFARMSEAFETLSDPVKRKRYLEVMKGGGGTPEEANKIQQILDAAADFQRGEILWKKNDPTAEQYIVRAYEADPEQADYAALYATLQLSKRQADAPVDDLIRLCDRAIDSHERCERAYFCRALLRKRVGKMDAAMVDFRAAYEINPKNLDAAREVRLYEMRRARQSPERQSSPGGVIRRSAPPALTKSTPAGRSSIPPRRSASPPTKKEGGVFSGLGKLFKR